MPNLNVGLSLVLGFAVDANVAVEDEFVDIKIWFDNRYTNGFGAWSAIYSVKDCSGEDYTSYCSWGWNIEVCVIIVAVHQSTVKVHNIVAAKVILVLSRMI